jgi:DNA-binding transcriptional ArsR family regulator
VELMSARGLPLPAPSAAAGIAMQIGFSGLMIIGVLPAVATLGLTSRSALTTLRHIYNHIVMEQVGYTPQRQDLDAVFAALADPTRRAILSRLAAGEASVNEIAAPFEISQPAVSRHLKVLEQAGLIERDVDKQRRPARLKAEPMAAAVSWLEEFKRFWSSSFDQLDDLLEELKIAEKKKGRSK